MYGLVCFRKDERRQKKEDKELGVPRISMDYFYLGEEDKEAKENPMIVMVDEGTGEKYTRAVGKKGAEGMDWLIKDISRELVSWGHAGGTEGNIIIKTDGEHSIEDVMKSVARFHGGRVIPEKPAKGESPSNGVVEEVGKTVRRFARVSKYQLEEQTGAKLEVASVLIQWMIRWAAMMSWRYL